MSITHTVALTFFLLKDKYFLRLTLLGNFGNNSGTIYHRLTHLYIIAVSNQQHVGKFYGFTYFGTTLGGFMPRALQLASWPVLGNLMGHPEVWFRFGYSSNGEGLMEGAYIDNIKVEVEHTDLIFGDGFEAGDTGAWSFVVP